MAPAVAGRTVPKTSGTVPIALAYSSPRLICNSIQSIFGTYLGELYINSYKWKPEHVGAITSICLFTLAVCNLGLGFAIDGFIKNDTVDDQDSSKLTVAKIIEVVSGFINLVSFFLLIVLPLKWSSAEMTGLSRLWNFICRRGSPTTFLDMDKPMFGDVSYGEQKSPLDVDLDPSSKWNSIMLFVKSRRFLIYTIDIVHAIGITLFDLCNRAIPTYIYPENKDSSSNGTDQNKQKRETLNSINLGFFGASNFLVTLVISLVKFFLNHIISDAELFFVLSILFVLLQIPIMPVFYMFTNMSGSSAATVAEATSGSSGAADSQASAAAQNGCNCCNNRAAEPECDKERGNDTLSIVLRLISVIVFHTSIHFLINTLGPTILYISTYILTENRHFKAFAPFVVLASFIVTSVIYTICGIFLGGDDKTSGKKGKGKKCCVDTGQCNCNGASGVMCKCCCHVSEDSKSKSKSFAEIIVFGVCILCQACVYFSFSHYKYKWNKSNWVHFILLMLCGVTCVLFLSTINNMIDKAVETDIFKKHKWTVLGVYFSVAYIFVAFSLYLLYNAFGKDEIKKYSRKNFRFKFRYNFPNVQKLITFIFQFADIVAACIYYKEDLIVVIEKLFPREQVFALQYKSSAEKLQLSLNSLDKMLEILKSIQ